jgi:hypothetical protein
LLKKGYYENVERLYFIDAMETERTRVRCKTAPSFAHLMETPSVFSFFSYDFVKAQIN